MYFKEILHRTLGHTGIFLSNKEIVKKKQFFFKVNKQNYYQSVLQLESTAVTQPVNQLSTNFQI